MEKLDMSNVGAHSMKATALSWMAKAMVSEKLRRLMGYHVKPKDTSLVIYSRDALAGGLDALMKVIKDIRMYRVSTWPAKIREMEGSAGRDGRC